MYIVTLENLIYILPALYTDPLRSNISHFYAIYHLYVCTFPLQILLPGTKYLPKAMDADCRQFTARIPSRSCHAEPAGLLPQNYATDKLFVIGI